MQYNRFGVIFDSLSIWLLFYSYVNGGGTALGAVAVILLCKCLHLSRQKTLFFHYMGTKLVPFYVLLINQ